ncbi:hypothetical protein NQZ68_030668 [Dissostichus eleginoides]|nr:hypothetical protein NQZ68_030668 [Dissostichus eleginoides]
MAVRNLDRPTQGHDGINVFWVNPDTVCRDQPPNIPDLFLEQLTLCRSKFDTMGLQGSQDLTYSLNMASEGVGVAEDVIEVAEIHRTVQLGRVTALLEWFDTGTFTKGLSVCWIAISPSPTLSCASGVASRLGSKSTIFMKLTIASAIALSISKAPVYYHFNPSFIRYCISCDSRHVEIILHEFTEGSNILSRCITSALSCCCNLLGVGLVLWVGQWSSRCPDRRPFPACFCFFKQPIAR